MSLVKQIKSDRITAMKNKDAARRATLELVLALLEKEKVVHKLDTVESLTDEQAEVIINRYIKGLDKESEAYEAAGKSTEKQEREKELLLTYLPERLSEEQIRDIVAGAVAVAKADGANLGKVMGYLSSLLKGKADMGLVNRIAKEEFSK
jgi:uncharacterized protein YqeY